LALCGEVVQAQALVNEMAQRRPKATLNNAVYWPVIRAAIELRRDHPERALQLLQETSEYEGVALFWPNYLRGQASLRLGQGVAATAEFQKMLEHQGWAPLSAFYPLAHLGLARASAMRGDAAKARKSYQDFFALWKDADTELPILIEAKKEYETVK